jgi:hypothetical protein
MIYAFEGEDWQNGARVATKISGQHVDDSITHP